MATCPGGFRVSEDFQAFEAVEQNGRHFRAVDSELMSCKTSETLASTADGADSRR